LVKSINAYKSTVYWKNLTIIKTYVIFYSIFGSHFEKNGLFQPKFETPILPYLISVDLFAIAKNTIYNDLKKNIYWPTPSYVSFKRFKNRFTLNFKQMLGKDLTGPRHQQWHRWESERNSSTYMNYTKS